MKSWDYFDLNLGPSFLVNKINEQKILKLSYLFNFDCCIDTRSTCN